MRVSDVAAGCCNERPAYGDLGGSAVLGVLDCEKGKSECRLPAKKLGESHGERSDDSGPSF